MPNDREILAERVRLRIEEVGRSPRDVSMAAIGKPDLVRDIFRQKRMPTGPVMLDLARELGTTTEYLLGETDNPQQVRSEVTVNDRHLSWQGFEPGDPGIPLVGTGDCADIELCDESGQAVAIARNSFDPDYHQRYLARPPALRGAMDLYAITFHGESMVPRFEPGEVGIVDPRAAVRVGDYVVVQLTNGAEEDVESVLVKRFHGKRGGEVHLEQLNPAIAFTVPEDRVKRLHRVIPQTELLF